MFNSIKGVLTSKGSDYIRLENSGLEWHIKTTASSLSAFPPVGDKAKAHVYLHHKEDQMTLFGFSSPEERLVFFDLISVSGVGPKGALKILSGVAISHFIQYLENEDVTALSSIPGLGKKTAQKIILQLKGKLKTTGEKGGAGESEHSEIIESLTSMGFDRTAVKKAVNQCLKDDRIRTLKDEQKIQEVIRLAIIALSS